MPNTLGAGLGVTPFPNTTIYPETVDTGYPNALMIHGWCTGVPTDTTANRYAPSAVLHRTDVAAGNASLYINSGTAAVPAWTEIAQATGGVTYGTVAKATNGGTFVNLFGTTNGFNGTLTSVIGYGLDLTTGTLTLTGTNGTIASVAKQQINGSFSVVTGGSLSSASVSFTSAGTLQVSATAGQGILIATFITS